MQPRIEKKPINMVTRRSSRISLAILIICLCLGSLAAMPVMNAFSPLALELSEAGAENNDSSNQTEYDEELFLETILSATTSTLIFSKSRPNNLNFQTACLVPVSPPPKSA
jgi:hypothetical protein